MAQAFQAHTRYWQTGYDTRYGQFAWWGNRGGPQTQADLLDRPAWERRTGGTFEGTNPSAPGTATGLPTVIGGQPSDLGITADRVALYTIEVQDADGAVLVASVDFLAEGSRLELTLNEASKLTFKVAGDNAAIEHFIPENRLILRDRWGMALGRFQIRSRASSLEQPGAVFMVITALDALSQLGREPVVTGGTPTAITVQAIVEGLFGLQQQTVPLSLGVIDPAIANYETAFFVQDTSILGALRELHASMPKDIAGAFYVTMDGTFEWRVNIGTEEGTFAMALTGAQFEINYDDQINRLYMYGQGQDARTRLRLTDAGEAEEYIEDAASIASYGLLPSIKVESQIADPTVLLAAAQRILEDRAEPFVRFSGNMLDLAKADNGTIGYNDIYLGSRYTFSYPAHDIASTTLKVERMVLNLANPLPIDIEMANRRQSLDDIIRSLIRSQNPPLDVNDDGTLYPTIGRTFDTFDSTDISPRLEFKNGDWAYAEVDDEGTMNFYDQGLWQRVALYNQSGIIWGEVQDVFDDYLECKIWNVVNGTLGDTVLVAKHYLFQRTPFDTETITYIDGEEITYTADATYPEYKREHNDGTNYADFYVTPNWYIGEKILMAQMQTNVVVSSNRLEYMELPFGKVWAR